MAGLTKIKAGALHDDCVTAGNYADNSITGDHLDHSTALPDGVTATTQSAGDNSTKVATTAYADAAGGDSDKITEGNTTVEVVDTGSDGHITFDTEGSEKARFDTNGRLLIGHNANTTPAGYDHKVQITGTNGNTSSLSLTSNAGSSVHNEPSITFGKTRGSSGGASNAISSGDTIGTIQFAGGDGTDVASIAASIKCSADGAVSGNDMPGRLAFSTTADGASAPTERMRITQNGNIGIGTSDPATRVEIQSGQAELQLDSTSGTNSAGLRMIPGGETNAVYMYTDGNRNINFDDHSTAMLSIRAGGGGITFNGDTASANALDDYEEGSWTPTDQSGGSQNAITADGRYTKIGNLLFCTFDVEWPSTADTSTAAIGGFPYAAASNTTNLQGAGSISWTNYGAAVTFYMGSNTNKITFLGFTGSAKQNNQFSGDRIIGAITFRTAS